MDDKTTFAPITSKHIGVRIRHALGMSNAELAEAIGVPTAEVAALMSGRASQLVDVELDPTWQLISEYLSQRIGELMAARDELQRKMHDDRKRRALHRNRVRQR